MILQLDFFNEMNEIEDLQERIRDLEKSQDKLRKALFSRHGDLGKKYMEINDRLNILEFNICRGIYDKPRIQ